MAAGSATAATSIRFIAYERVPPASGLGPEQRNAIDGFATSRSAEVRRASLRGRSSGRNPNRPELTKAINWRAPELQFPVIAKLDQAFSATLPFS
jgi:hypothetical protein